VRVQEAITSIQKIEHPKSPRILRVFRLYAASYFGETHAILFYEHRAIVDLSEKRRFPARPA
ncbi:MAG: hypothetical protein MR740_07820, partial [Clostridium sp.]|nr:hypothetical protein [Clostridium sp.]MDD7138669.1 hypothetical protein [Clostridium sp.]MDY6081283.1 hypothetical protein [Eubacteriales bacterium]